MLPIPQYLYWFTLYFLKHYSPSDCDFPDILKRARNHRLHYLSPTFAADQLIEDLQCDILFDATPEGHMYKEVDRMTQEQHDLNMGIISNWARYELLMLISQHFDVPNANLEELFQWRKNLDSLIS